MAIRLKRTASVIILLAFVNMADGVWPFKKSSKVPQPKTGQFIRLEGQTESQQIRCNDAYYMMSYLHLTNPKYYVYPTQVDTLHRNINMNYSGWARKMLVTAFNVAPNDTDVHWLMYLYFTRIEAHVANDPRKYFLPVLRKAHYGMYEVLRYTMTENNCTMIHPKTKDEYKFVSYVADIERFQPKYKDFKKNSDAVIQILKKHWPTVIHNMSLGRCQKEAGTSGAGPSDQPLTEKHFTKNALYLNDVFENEKAATLLNDFGVFEDGNKLIRYLKSTIDLISKKFKFFGQYILFLVEFHEHVQHALKTIMLRIYYDFLEKLQKLNKDLREEHFKQFLRPFDEWCDFLDLPKESNGFYMSELPRSWTEDDTTSETIIPGTKKLVITTLTEISKTSKCSHDNHTVESLQKINIVEAQILMTAQKYEVTLDPKFEASKNLLQGDIRLTIMCAETLVAFMKNIFVHIDFRVIQSLIKLRNSKDFKQFEVYENAYDPYKA
ncbi:uncharacterized protein LOC126846727 [Adelges cooleyi]|uniref:uncharacterized protein LOC126846727 n=1 Tax=Adelges cooleyi TaxID=133065 RepID=UPI0021802554|nr:uncharacterized protein LOC126846727 [Adelges cooleyi]